MEEYSEQEEIDYDVCATCIQRWFRRCIDKIIFQRLKATLRMMEEVSTDDVLKLVSPMESAILCDPAFEARIRFRLGGFTFPPFIYYKVFVESPHSIVLDGQTMVSSSEVASIQAAKQMGIQKFSQVEWQSIWSDDEASNRRIPKDAKPPFLGGKGNEWRLVSEKNHPYVMGASPSYLNSEDRIPTVFSSLGGNGELYLHSSAATLMMISGGGPVNVQVNDKEEARRRKWEKDKDFYRAELRQVIGTADEPAFTMPGKRSLDVDPNDPDKPLPSSFATNLAAFSSGKVPHQSGGVTWGFSKEAMLQIRIEEREKKGERSAGSEKMLKATEVRRRRSLRSVSPRNPSQMSSLQERGETESSTLPFHDGLQNPTRISSEERQRRLEKVREQKREEERRNEEIDIDDTIVHTTERDENMADEEILRLINDTKNNNMEMDDLLGALDEVTDWANSL
ncbi:hypothetical protein BLNAU_16035 [Blattamonas nauphoetae]|uniref:Uncharacterized protein n=1 Tax=Blattamonas nauphoetae TaxID=2049346 RepID=A0ABQ9XCS3_9EUKA|nr:hypothetical protein BLNAU_16035 [Blattamonas nauphoetae]